MSAHDQLRWVIFCQHPPCAAWEPIAAFNVDSVAIAYARDCFKVNPFFAYRVAEYDEPVERERRSLAEFDPKPGKDS